MRIRRIMGATAIVVGSLFFMGGIASAHDVTPDEGSQCTSPTTGEVKFNATNMGSEERDLFVYLNGNLVGSLLDFTGNGSHKVDIVVPPQPPQMIAFTWTTDAVAHGDSTIYIDWSKPKCQPEVTTIPTTIATTTSLPCDEDECETTTVATTIATTTTAATTTVAQTTTTQGTTTTSTPCDVTHSCISIPETTASTIATTTTAPVTTIPDTTAVDQTVPPAALVPATTVTPTTVPELPHTGASTAPEIALGLGLVTVGGLVLAGSRRRTA